MARLAPQLPRHVDQPQVPPVIWAVWDCSELAAVFTEQATADAFRRDRITETTDAYPALADLVQQSVTTVPVRLHLQP